MRFSTNTTRANYNFQPKSVVGANHLGNVLTVVSDRKFAASLAGSPNLVDHYNADIISSTDYYPFGSTMSTRSFNAPEYKYGFNGKEKDDETNVGGGSYDFGARIYDSRIGRWWIIDPLFKKYPLLLLLLLTEQTLT